MRFSIRPDIDLSPEERADLEDILRRNDETAERIEQERQEFHARSVQYQHELDRRHRTLRERVIDAVLVFF